MVFHNGQDIIERVRKAIDAAGSQSAWARKMKISEAYLSDFLQGKRGAGPLILNALNYDPAPWYKSKRTK